MIRSDLALAALACAAVPGMRPVTVQEGRRAGPESEPTHQSALVEDVTGRTWVISCPLTAVAAVELERNDSLVRQLGRHMPFRVPAAAGYASLGSLGRAAVFPYVEGSALDLHRLPAGPGLANAVGRALAAVHNIPAGLFEEHGVPVFDATDHRARRLADLDRAAETGHVPTGLLARWEQVFEAAPVWQFHPTPVHGSLDGWSFLVAFAGDDAATGRVVALTGWGHAAVSDPAEDFAHLVDEATPAAVDSVLESYALARSQRPDAHLHARARLAGEMQWVRGLATAVSTGDDDAAAQRVDQLRKLDRLTSADDPLVPTHLMVSGGAGEVVEVSEDSAGDAVVADQEDFAADEHQHPGPEGAADGGVLPEHTGDRPEPVTGDPHDRTEPIPVVRPDDDPDDRARLHDLYGMPEEPEDADDTGEPAGGEGSDTERGPSAGGSTGR